jgi:hypothetical protein
MTTSADIPPQAIKAFGPDDFLRALGAALLAWQAVEHSTFRLFHALVGTDDLNISGSIFFTPDSFGVRLKMVQNLILASVPSQKVRDEWADVRRDIDEAVKHRNKMAHWTAAADFDDSTGTMDLALVRSMFRPAAMTKDDLDKVNTPRLIELHDEFGKLSLRIDAITHMIAALS